MTLQSATRLPRRRAALLALLLLPASLAGCAAGTREALSAPPAAAPSVLSLADVQALADRTDHASEPSVATREDGRVIVVANMAWTDEPGSTRAYDLTLHRSTDHGRTWSVTALPPEVLAGRVPPGTRWSVADPVLSYGPRGELHLAAIALLVTAVPDGRDPIAGQFTGASVFVTRSDDDGATWSPASFYQQGAGTFGFPVLFAGAFHDKEWLATGPDGSLHLAWVRYEGAPTSILYASAPDGRTWSEPRRIALAAPGEALHGPMVAAPAPGWAYVGYMRIDLSSLAGAEEVIASRDGGATFGPPVATVPAGAGRFAALFADAARPMRVCTAGVDGRSPDVHVSCSADGGRTFAPLDGPDIPSDLSAVKPAGAFLPDGGLLLAYYLDATDGSGRSSLVVAAKRADADGWATASEPAGRPRGNARGEYLGLSDRAPFHVAWIAGTDGGGSTPMLARVVLDAAGGASGAAT